MDFIEIITIGIGLSMDAFAVSICKGLAMKKMHWLDVVIIALFFGVSHVIMLMIGYLLGTTFSSFVESVDHWIAFVLLLIIGGKMINDATFKKEAKKRNEGVNIKSMLALMIATSIDALAIGVTFAFFEVNVFLASIVVGLITFLLSMVGVRIGGKFGDKLKSKAEFTGGFILIIIGIKILLEHLGVIGF